MEIAAVAYLLLNDRIRQKVDDLLKLNPDYTEWIAGAAVGEEAKAAFVRAATWADDIKKPSSGYQNDKESPDVPRAFLNIGYADRKMHRYWHYKDIEFSPDGTRLPEKSWINAENVTKVFRDTLASGASDDIKSYDLVWLIHLVGDAHQPLHATEPSRSASLRAMLAGTPRQSARRRSQLPALLVLGWAPWRRRNAGRRDQGC